MSDVDGVFHHAAVQTVGSSHDSTSYSHTELSFNIDAGLLDWKFWTAADDAYSSLRQMMTPYPGKKENLTDKQSGFNFWLSNSRITVECAFGMLVRRWGVLKRALETSVTKHKEVVYACMLLHNLCRMESLEDDTAFDGAYEPRSSSYRHMRDFVDETKMKFPTQWVFERDLIERESRRGRRVDRARTSNEVRDCLAEDLLEAGLGRPKPAE